MHACSCMCIRVGVSLTYNTQPSLPETETFCVHYSCPGKKIRDKETYTGLRREKIWQALLQYLKGRKHSLVVQAQNCIWPALGAGTSPASASLWMEIPWLSRAFLDMWDHQTLTEGFPAALVIIRRRGERVSDSFQTVGYEVRQQRKKVSEVSRCFLTV